MRRERRAEVPEDDQVAPPSDEIDDMLARLSDSERAALVLCEGHGWTHAEAADLLTLPLGTLKSTVARAKAKCRAMWEGADHG
jgi:DNA-directed RNA polymerase specialized sigma24 family protein